MDIRVIRAIRGQKNRIFSGCLSEKDDCPKCPTVPGVGKVEQLGQCGTGGQTASELLFGCDGLDSREVFRFYSPFTQTLLKLYSNTNQTF